MTGVVDINTRDVQNLVNGNVAGDQVGGSKFGGDQVLGNKVTVDMHNIIFDPTPIRELGLKISTNDNLDNLQRIGQLVLVMMLAELKERSLSSPSTTVTGLSEIRHALEEFHTLHYTGTFDTGTEGHGGKFSDLLPLVADPHTTLRYYSSMRNIRRRKEGKSSASPLHMSRQLQGWAAKPGSSQLLVKGSFRARHTLRDFAADMVDLLHKEKRLVAWVLQCRDGKSGNAFDAVDVLKQLVSQIVQQAAGIPTERSASLIFRRIQDASSVDDWFSVLGSVLNGVEEVYLLLDTAAFTDQAQECQWSSRFDRLFEELRARRVFTAVRVVFINCRQPMSRRLQADLATVIDVSASHAVQRLQSRPWRPTKRATGA